MSNDKIVEAYAEALESADVIPMTSEELFRLGYQAALSQQPEIEPNRIQRSKLEFLTSRDDYVAHRDESVIRVRFAGYEHCYLDRFGRVLWLNDPSELVRPQPSTQVPDGWQAAAKVALEFARCPGATNYPQNCIAHIEGLAKLILSAAPSIAEKEIG